MNLVHPRDVMLDQWPDEDRRWRLFQNYWFNCIRDCVRQVQRRDRGNSTCWRQDHIPLMIHHPACPGGRECAAVTSQIDLAPTILGLAGRPGQR
ncbi:MAG: hypothetical protein WCK73_15250 [Deltaproteobacteria bacterium]